MIMILIVFDGHVANIAEYFLTITTSQSIVCSNFLVDFTASLLGTKGAKFNVNPFQIFIAMLVNDLLSHLCW